MKFGLMVTGLLCACLSPSILATTLILSPDIDLLVVDGKKMTGSLLKGADSLELDGGQHQLLFRVTKSLPNGKQMIYRSSILIAAFNTQNVTAVSIQLPPISSQQDGQRFEQRLNYQIIDNKEKPLFVTKDKLPLSAHIADHQLEQAVADYNVQSRPASVLTFAHQHHSRPAATSSVNTRPQRAVPVKEADVALRMLQYWFKQADSETQQSFLQWANQHRDRQTQ
ncbi:DUF2057 family protein [Serratia sp. NPDC078593]|uniref:DUF2057 family protein n=1 Tax=unclassified Serratia (in: enterobacteria) TaxID=2647522 RepID=UPI0037D958A5